MIVVRNQNVMFFFGRLIWGLKLFLETPMRFEFISVV